MVDARTKQDLTRSILLQIIMEQEEDGEPIFNQEILSQMIRFYGDSLQGAVTNYFEKSFRMFVEQQEAMRTQMQNMMVNDPLSYVRNLTEKNMSMWRDIQEGFFRAAMPKAREEEKEPDKD